MNRPDDSHGNGAPPSLWLTAALGVLVAAFLLTRLSAGGGEELQSASLLPFETWHIGAGEIRKNRSGPRPLIAIVIDDLGIDAARTREAVRLPASITLSFLPYPPLTPHLSAKARAAGHEVLVHLPMQPEGSDDPGPMMLAVGQSDAEILTRLDWALARVSGYDGVNNHMGSRFTASPPSLAPLMRGLKSRRLLFLDSRTTRETRAESMARDAGLLTGARDIFLDDVPERAAIASQLALAESEARVKGSVIAIGHPRAETLGALKQWAAAVTARGFVLVPLRDVLRLRAQVRALHAQVRALHAQVRALHAEK